MLKKIFEYSFSAVLAVLLLWGVVRAATPKYAQQRQEIFNQCGADRRSAGVQPKREVRFDQPLIGMEAAADDLVA